jgi:UDPglucose--hexose-1-phosphate uridylyltransferase
VGELRVDPLTGLRLLLGGEGLLLDPHAPPPGPASPAAGPMLGQGANPSRDLFWASPAEGSFESIPHPGDAATLAELGASALATAVEDWRRRILAHPGAACVHLAVDEPADGAGAGARLYALAFVPQLVAREREHFGAYATRTMGGNLLADLVQEEVRRRERIVAIDDEAVLMAPYGSRASYQLLIAPRRPRARFEADGPTGAGILHDALRRLSARFGGCPPLNLFVRTAPRGAEHFCWRIELLPRLRRPGGLELGTGLQFNPVAPELAADELRSV